MKKIMFILACSLVFISCEKDDDGANSATQILHYDQTQCADGWGANQTDNATLINLQNYLNAKGLYHSSESIKKEFGEELCNACACRTGKVIYVRTLVSQQQAYLDMRFKK